ncbi:MAG TPA: tetraacyldisaccharide 4'-kinase [Deltaproteobacteria bacterium]|nr:MAG: tetraacyldisaccharide 4'-kinase [Deltaproteobacteria bacterium GWC2_65_14]HBO70027.1 tetraacyldisaccharide 4'-kinase [Deltaproteobacteria bacterium]
MIGLYARARRMLHRSGVFRAKRLPRPVISVGNLSVGGSGKTPHVLFLAKWLAGLGLRVAVLSRGYRRKSRGVVWVSDGEGAQASAGEAGDEPALLAASLPGTAVIVGESRYEAGMECLRKRDADVFVLDDGFSHLSLERDVDILLVDGTMGLGNGRTLPFGPLREPPGHARFADALVVTRCDSPDLKERVLSGLPFPADRPAAASRMVPGALVGRDGAEVPVPVEGEDVAAFSGIARNERFEETLKTAGFRVKVFLRFGDHHWYTPRDLERIRAEAGGLPVLTTEKDLVRIPGQVPFPVRALRIGVEFVSGWEDLSRLVLDRIGRSRTE